MSEVVKASELQIGDIIRLSSIDNGYADCTVYNLENGSAHLIRPYIHTADFLHTGGVITYIGQEDFSIPLNDTMITRLSSRSPEENRLKIRAIISDIKAELEEGNTCKALDLLRQL